MALTLFARCESDTLDATHDYTAGDNTWSAVLSPVFATGAARVGTYGMSFDGTGDFYDLSAASIVLPAAGAIGFWVNISNWVSNGHLLIVFGTVTNDQLMVQMSGTDEINFKHRVAGVTQLDLTTTAANLTTGNWYFIIIRWHAANDDRRLEVYDSSMTLIQAVEDTSTAFTAQPDLITLRVGTNSGADFSIDNIFVANDYSEPIESNATISTYLNYGAGSSTIVIPNAASMSV